MSFSVPELFYRFEKWEKQLSNFSRTNEINVGFSFFAFRKLPNCSRDLFNVPGVFVDCENWEGNWATFEKTSN